MRRQSGARRRRVEALADVLVRFVTPLAARVRRRFVTELAREILLLDPAVSGLEGASLLAALALDARKLGVRLAQQLAARDGRWEELTRLYYGRGDERRRRRLIVDYLTETVPNAHRLRGDLAALDRWLDYEALRERHALARHHALVALELAVTVAGRAAEAALADPTAAATTTSTLLEEGGLGTFLERAGEKGPRWQIRAAALDGLRRVVRSSERTGARQALERAHLGTAGRIATNPEEHPWVQGAALELALALASEAGLSLCARRLFEPCPGPRDFLVRRQVVDLLGRHAGEAALGILARAVAAQDPSEHVRLGLCMAALHLAPAGGLSLLSRLGGPDEPSAKVRMVALAQAGRAGTLPACLSQVVAILERALRAEKHPQVLVVACEAAAVLARELSPAGRPGVASLLPSLIELSSRPESSPTIHETAAAAAEAIATCLDGARDAWREQLARVASSAAPGERRPLALVAPGLPPVPDDPVWLGRILAQLARRDFALAVGGAGRRLWLQRGDRFARRLWRILHELGRPAPDKRKGFLHTIGRVQPGVLRASPGEMYEVTATVVPGERVFVGAEGGWGRHLPTVDDYLDLPLFAGSPVRLFSSHGVTTIVPPASLVKRLRNRVGISRHYARLAALRTQSLAGAEPRERQRYVAELQRRFGIETHFERYRYAAAPVRMARHVAELFYELARAEPAAGGAPPRAGAALVPAPLVDAFMQYLQPETGNSQTVLAAFLAAAATLFFGQAYWTRHRIRRARRRIPLTIGGWGTRGKSGSERLKAGFLHGLGYEVFSKTTGCEAMFIHSAPDEPLREVFIFRPYDKATVWEQRDIVELAAALRTEVFLWECMALNPRLVELLERDWMQDDLATLTNAYPDHEDIQGPAGFNVAECIATFIPRDSVLVTSELSFLPLFAERCRQRGTQMHSVSPLDADGIGDDLLALFPYSEHPRNIAMVARLAEELGVERNLAMTLMAEHVVPDLGVLKTYPPARVRGRVVQFVNGMSANERTGFLNNWQRTGLGELDPAVQPDKTVVTVVNNRWDRVSRSNVFAHIIVEDAVADAHVLIGTNLQGLRTYAAEALVRHVATLEVIVAEDLAPGGAVSRLPFSRLEQHMRRLRVPPPDVDGVMARLDLYAAGGGLSIDPGRRDDVRHAVASLLAPGPQAATDWPTVRAEIGHGLALLQGALAVRPAGAPTLPPEVLEPPDAADVLAHSVRQVARIALHARLRARLKALVARPDPAAMANYHEVFRAAWRELWEDLVVVVADPNETGDQIIERCALAVPPGTSLMIMGIQNIKGTGLDFAYRWLAWNDTSRRLANAVSESRVVRLQALRELASFEDYGLVDAGTAAATLAARRATAVDDDEAKHLEHALQKVSEVHAERRRALTQKREEGRRGRLLAYLERWLDPFDSIRRRRRASRIMKDLVAHRISHATAAYEMRAVYHRQKGGWLQEALGGAAAAPPAVAEGSPSAAR